MKRLITTLLVFLAIDTYAQDSININSGLITKKGFGPSYRLNGKKLSMRELEVEIYKVPAAILYFKKAKTNKILSFSFYVPMIVFALATSQGNYRYRSDSTYGPQRGLQIAGILSASASLYFVFHSFGLYKKAVRARNSALKTIY